MSRTNTIIALAIAAGSVTLGAWINGARWESKYQQLELSQTKRDLKDANGTIKLFEDFGQNFTDALQDAEYKRGLNDKAQQDLADTLRNLRTDVNGVRGDVADVSRRVQGATAAALAEYTTTCTAVFADVVTAGEGMASRGAEIAGKAEGHAVDAKQTVDSWPRVRVD